MEPIVRAKNHFLIVQMAGDIDLVNADKLKFIVDKQLEQGKYRNLILNLENVDFIDSSGLGAILGRYKRISQAGGKVYLINPKPQVLRILSLSGFTNIMPVFQTEDQAIGELA